MSDPVPTAPVPPVPASPVPAPASIPPDRTRIDPSPPRGIDVLPILYLLGFIILAGALAYLWRHPTLPRGEAVQETKVDTLSQELDARQKETAALTQRIDALEHRPVAAPVDLAPLDTRLSAVEHRPVQQPANLQPLSDRIAALENKPTVDLKPLSDQVAALQARPAVDLAPLEARITALAAAQAAAGTQSGAIDTRLKAVESQAKQIEAQAKQIEAQAKQTAAGLAAITDRAQRVARAQSAAVALAAGQPLGDLPGAPPALSRFAHQAPPTEAALRLSFDAAATAAQRASLGPAMQNQSFGERMWTRAQQSLSVRQGDHVLLGDPIAGLIQHARQQLDAGDLGGAVHTLGAMTGPARAAMADWIGQAQSLIDARAAVSSLASSGVAQAGVAQN